jgi:hypothetical protein
MLGTNDVQTDMDIIVILPKITLGNVEPIFGDHANCLYQSLKVHNGYAQQIGGANSRIPLIRLFYYGIQSNKHN